MDTSLSFVFRPLCKGHLSTFGVIVVVLCYVMLMLDLSQLPSFLKVMGSVSSILYYRGIFFLPYHFRMQKFHDLGELPDEPAFFLERLP